MLLSDRMRAVVDLVQPCKSIADVGCDHGYVAMELVRSNICRNVIAMDINKGPLDRAKNNIIEYGMQDYIETRLSNGVCALKAGETEGIVCAGMGGKLVISILEQGKELVRSMKQIILQPQSELNEVRSYLRENGHLIDQENMVYEDGKYYMMMRVLPCAFEKQQPLECSKISGDEVQRLTRVQDTYGPCLLETAHPVLKQYLLWKKANFEQIRANLLCRNQMMTQKQQYRVAEIDENLRDIEFCLSGYYS